MRASPARILLADDHALVRSGLRMILDAEPDLQVVAEAADGHEALAALDRTPTDLAILDIAMPRMTGLQAAREINRTHPHVRMLILSMYDNEQYFFEALKAGASGYVLKSVADRDLLEACRATLRGEPFLYAGAVTALIRDYLHRARQGDGLPDTILTPREEEVLKLIAEGYSARESPPPWDQRQDSRPAPNKHLGQTRFAGPAGSHSVRDQGRSDRALTSGRRQTPAATRPERGPVTGARFRGPWRRRRR